MESIQAVEIWAIRCGPADPVTGTTGTFSGSSSVGGKDGETEPLGGQSIEVVQPANPPTNYNEILGHAQDTEWQCMLEHAKGSGFLAMPVPCQKEALAQNTSIHDLFGWSWNEDSPAMAAPGGPHEAIESGFSGGAHDSGSDAVLSSTLTASTKQTGGPSADDTDGIGCDSNDPDDPCVVNVNGDDSIPYFVDASQAGRPLNSQEKTAFDLGRERARKAFRDSKKCRDAIAAILKGVAGQSFLPDMTMTFRDGSSLSISPINDFVYETQTDSSDYLNAYDAVEMQASGVSGSDGNSTTFAITHASKDGRTGLILSAPITWNKEFFSLGTDAMARHIIHEIIHQYASDAQVANYIAGKNNFTEKDTGKASEYFNDYLSSACSLPTQ